MSDVAKLSIGEHELELPVIVGTENEQGLDISKLRGMTGIITLDEGFVNTGSTQSAITFLDGEKEFSDIEATRSKKSARSVTSSIPLYCC